MINALELYRQIKDQWDTTSKPLKERGVIAPRDTSGLGNLIDLPEDHPTISWARGINALGSLAGGVGAFGAEAIDSMLPLGTYKDGSTGLAVPSLIQTPIDGLKNFGQYGYGEEAVPYNTRMAFDAAGGAMTGAGPAHIATAMTAKRFPVGGLADDAVGSAGADFAKSNSLRQTNEYLSNLHQNLQDAEANYFQLSKGREGWQKAYAQRAKTDADRFRKLIAEAESPRLPASEPEATNQKMLFQDVPQAYAQPEPPRIEAVPFSGNPIQAFRGQRSAENVFNWSPGTRADPDTSYWWGSSSPEVASTYTDNRQGSVVVPSELRFRNPLEIDVGGNEGLFVPWKGGVKTTEQVADLARAAGHDGLILQNIMDQGWSDDVLPPATTYAALKRGTVYSPVTGDLLYSNAPTGSSVPLAVNALERAQPQGIRAYDGAGELRPSTGPMDLDGAAYSRELPSVARMLNVPLQSLDDAAGRAYRAGYDPSRLWYHGGPEGIEAFDAELTRRRTGPGVWLTDTYNYASLMAGKYGKVYPLYAKMQNPVAEDVASSAQRLADDGTLGLSDPSSATNYEKQMAYFGDYGVDAAVKDMLREGSNPDAVLLQNFWDLPFNQDNLSTAAFVRDPRNIRSVNAAFDPSKSDSANLLAANAPTGAAFPVGMEASQADTDPALLDYLRAVGLY